MDDVRNDAAVAAALLITEMVRENGDASESEMLVFIRRVVHEAIKEAERRLGGFRHDRRISVN